jgi:hypothetical protein
MCRISFLSVLFRIWQCSGNLLDWPRRFSSAAAETVEVAAFPAGADSQVLRQACIAAYHDSNVEIPVLPIVPLHQLRLLILAIF